MQAMLFPGKPLILLAAAIAVAIACPPVLAQEAGSNGKKEALIRLLVRAGKNEEAAATMRSLYPKGPPAGGEMALEYYDVIGNTDRGWEEAKAGLERLVKAAPEDVNYQLTLARHLARRAATRRSGMQIFAEQAKRKDIDKQQVLDQWRRALGNLDSNAASIPLYEEYLAFDPGNTSIRDALVDAKRAEAKDLPWQMRDQADAQLAAGHPEQAEGTLKRALQLDPKNAWVRFDLSRLYHKQGDEKRGRALMQGGMSAAPGDADMLYANALYVSLLDEADSALQLLDRIPAGQRSASMQRLRQKMVIEAQTQQAQAFFRNGKVAEMQAAMQHAENDAGNDAELLNIVANAWVDLNEPARGVALMRPLAVRKSAPVATRLYYAKLLNRTGQNDTLAAVLADLSARRGLSAGDKEDLRYLQASLAQHRADSLRQAGKIAAARSVLTAALKKDPENVDMLMALARVHVAAHEPQQARDIYQNILKKTPGDVSARLALARAMGDAGETVAAQHEMATVLANTPPDDLDDRMAIADWYIDMKDFASARAIVDQSRKLSPDNPRLLVQAGRIAKAENHYSEAMDAFKRANATDEVANLQHGRASGYVTAGVDYLSKTDGTPGISNLKSIEVPVEMRMPVGYGGGRIFVQVDPVSADAGTLPTDAYDLSQYGHGGMTGANVSQSAHGTALAAGYEGDGLRADIGTTPLGFPVSDVIGGVKWSHYTADSGFSFDVSRRPVTSSLVSYAGAHDPATNEVWGGVRSTGVSMHVSRDYGRLNVFADPGYYRLTGRNVLSNTEYALRTGLDWSYIREEDTRLTAGLAITAWHYNENLRYYTFGHGGYYSPQRYYSLALPVRLTGRKERWSYLLQGSVSASVSYEKDMYYYPLQGPTGNPVYAGGKGHGTGWSLGGAMEYKFTPQLFGGAQLQIDRSEYYTPNFAILYLRYMFDAQTGAVPYPPEPVKAYSRY